ncbi:MAG TPA: hypothetical protein VFY29_06390 [Terriglobia bacterium]|nr:hypothetical protein [Terriglobia bacterium]
MADRRLIFDELAGFLESGLSITVGARDGDLRPEVVVAWAARVNTDRDQLTIFLHKEAARTILRNLRTHPEIAVAFDLPTSHRACQIKGAFVSTRSARTGERAEIERQVAAFNKDLEAIGFARSMVLGWSVWPCAAIEFRVTEMFEQTPGPGAGERIS